MEAIQHNSIILFTFLGIAEWAIVGTIAAIIVSRLYLSKSRELQQLKLKQRTTVIQEAPQPDIAELLQQWIEQSEQQLRICEPGQAKYIQHRIAFLQSELIAAADQNSESYWDDLCTRISSIVPDPSAESDQTNDEDITVAEAAQLLEVPDFLDEDDAPADQIENSDDNSLEALDDDLEELFAEQVEVLPGVNDKSNLGRISNNLQKQFTLISSLKTAFQQPPLAQHQEVVTWLEQTEVANAHIRLAANALAKEIADLEQALDSMQEELQNLSASESDTNSSEPESREAWQDTVDELSQQIEDREQIIEQLQEELESLRTQLLQQQNELEDARNSSPENARVFIETDEPEQLTHQIESLTDLLVQKSELLAELQTDLPLPEDAFESDDTIQQVLEQQENNQMFLPELDDVVHPSYVSASYDLTPQQEAMIDDIEDIDLSIDDDIDITDDVDDDSENNEPPLSNSGAA